jgi:hypothetical protein
MLTIKPMIADSVPAAMSATPQIQCLLFTRGAAKVSVRLPGKCRDVITLNTSQH